MSMQKDKVLSYVITFKAVFLLFAESLIGTARRGKQKGNVMLRLLKLCS